MSGAEEFDAIDVTRMLKLACKATGSQRAWAEENQISHTVVCDVLCGRRDPSPGIVRALGLRPKPPRYERVPQRAGAA